jgi:hypothetical protein
MVINFKAHKISRGMRKVTRAPTLIFKKRNLPRSLSETDFENICILLIMMPPDMFFTERESVCFEIFSMGFCKRYEHDGIKIAESGQ